MSRIGALIARLPVRVRVTLAFTLVMAVLLAITGAFLYSRVGAALHRTVDVGLRNRAADVSALIARRESGFSGAGRSRLTEQGETLAQLLDTHGRVVDTTPAVRTRPLLTPAQAARASERTLITEVPDTGEEQDRLRVLATAATSDGRRVIVVVAATLEPTREAQQTLRGQLLLGGPLLLLIAALAGYGAAAAALRPVESMRRRAAGIQAGAPGGRLPVPPSGDELARLGETLNDMLGRLEAAFARERAFVADASHELRTPLAILKGELELALTHAQTVGAFREAVGAAAEETDRVVQLAEDLLVIARADEDQLRVRPELVDVRALLEATAQRFASRAAERDAALRVDAPAGLRVHGDPLRLEQALGNLTDNALRHGAGDVTLRAAATGGGVRLEVEDQGGGFPPAFLPTAFDRFSRADAARGRGGSGLGLAIVRAIAVAHGGGVEASNAPDGGGRLRITLPHVG